MELSAYIYAFIIGGAICVIGQLLISLTRLTSARVLVLFVVSGVVLTGLGLYEPLVRLAGAGATTRREFSCKHVTPMIRSGGRDTAAL